MDIFGNVMKALEDGRNFQLSGMSGSCRAYFLGQLANRAESRDLLCICPTEEKAVDLYRDLMAFAGEERVRLFPARDFVFLKESAYTAHSNRVKTLTELICPGREPFIIVASPQAIMYRLMSPQDIQARTIDLYPGLEIDRDELLQYMVYNEYQRVDMVAVPGEFAVRGGIVDIFTALSAQPVRIEFFGNEIESIRLFQPETQRSTERVERFQIAPADELDRAHSRSDGPKGACLWDYLHETVVVLEEVKDVLRNLDKNLARYDQFVKEATRQGKSIQELNLITRERFRNWLNSQGVLYHGFFSSSLDGIVSAGFEHIHSQDMESFYLRYDSFAGRLKEWQSAGHQITLLINNPDIKKKIQTNLKEARIKGVKIKPGQMDKGFISRTLNQVVVTERDLLGKKAAPRPPARSKGREARDTGAMLDSLRAGDYVVHENYGIALYHGMQKINQDGASKDFLLLQFAGADRLYLPVDRLEYVHRYALADEKEPRLSKLGGAEWQKTRSRVVKSIHDMAQELMTLYAERENVSGFSFDQDGPWQQQFEENFPYTETPDQLRAIEETKADMEVARPMDRLICGDVGYGKTEVALRAAFKAVMAGKQVVLLVPTTVLAEQHYDTFKERFKDFPVTIEALSRFKGAREQKRIVQDLERGVTDIVIGTHRLLSGDVKMARLGLLIIDEEHRFGVSQKEKIKFLKRNVDVLSLSATPIPRSLHLALSGMRDLSVIETPPPERYPVTTYVMEHDEEVIRQAIEYELERGGQVFYVHNRIQDMGRVKEKLQALVPNASITVGHGRMSEDELERNLVDFVKGRHDILLCTTIIESGLDMPNVNTMIIEMADRLGLAQLYQLRGRVGRSDRLAYAYLTYTPDRVMTEEAQKRLNAIRDFNELGAGLKIAMRDLEIRGAGNILGAEQHGYMHAVGFDLYCSMLEEERHRLEGSPVEDTSGPVMDIDMDLYVPETYIADPGQKMKLYRRLLMAADLEEVAFIADEIIDRYGPLPVSLDNFFRISRLRLLARSKQIKGIHRSGKKVVIQVGHPIPPELMKMLQKQGYKRQGADSIAIMLEDRSLERLEQLIEAL